MWDLALGFNDSDGGKIKKMISNFLKEEIIANDYYCSKCKCKEYQLGRFQGVSAKSGLLQASQNFGVPIEKVLIWSMEKSETKQLGESVKSIGFIISYHRI